MLLYSLFWVIPWHLNFMFRRFGTLCSIFTGGVSRNGQCSETLEYKIQNTTFRSLRSRKTMFFEEYSYYTL